MQISFHALQEAEEPHLPPQRLHPLLTIWKGAHEHTLVVKILTTLMNSPGKVRRFHSFKFNVNLA